MEKLEQKCSEGNTKTSEPKFRNWCFTSFNELEPNYDEKSMKYLAFGSEICPSTQKHHWQGFVCFKNPRGLKGIKKILGNIHLEPIKGTLKQNEKYCSKAGEYTTYGILPSQGERKDLIKIKDEIMEGKQVKDIILEDPYLYHQYGRTLEKVEDLMLRKQCRKEITEGYWYWGETGVGKSHKAFENYDPETHYNLPNDNGWWDGYCGQETIIINDFRGEIPYNQLLTIVDKWPYNVRRRGREPFPLLAKTVIITSSLPPHKIYHNRDTEDDIKQLKRRFNIINLKLSPLKLFRQ